MIYNFEIFVSLEAYGMQESNGSCVSGKAEAVDGWHFMKRKTYVRHFSPYCPSIWLSYK